MPALPPPIPAATLIVMRERPEGAPEILMVERAGHMAFAAGALVFPGGRIDPADHALAAMIAADTAEAAARIAAIRETIEETGIAPALKPTANGATIAAMRAAMARGTRFPDAIAAQGLALDLDALTPFARWCPNFQETRRFDTLFYLVEAPGAALHAVPDRGEAVRAFWASAADILCEVAAKRAHAIFPTRRNLERLARFASIAAARQDALRHPVRRITPWVETREGRQWVCIPDDAGYPVTAELLETARRR